jgi:hypothetical protein
MPSFAERIKIAIDTLRMKSGHDDGKVIIKIKSFFFRIIYDSYLV